MALPSLQLAELISSSVNNVAVLSCPDFTDWTSLLDAPAIAQLLTAMAWLMASILRTASWLFLKYKMVTMSGSLVGLIAICGATGSQVVLIKSSYLLYSIMARPRLPITKLFVGKGMTATNKPVERTKLCASFRRMG